MTLSLFILLIFSGIIFIQTKIHLFEQEVEKYLLNEKGYNLEEIASIKGNFNPKAEYAHSISAEVKFSDEPIAFYVYYKVNGKIQQVEFSGNARFHIEK